MVVKLCLAILFSLLSISVLAQTDLSSQAIIPKPVLIESTGSSFRLSKNSKISLGTESADLLEIARYFSSILKDDIGLTLSLVDARGDIELAIDKTLPKEGYNLFITKKKITIEGGGPAGVFYGIQTLRQLISRDDGSKTPTLNILTGEIHDFPRYQHRGSMLDVSRHFFGVEEVKKYIDLLAFYKMNILHLHLSDDQGWRIEIKSWPDLTAHGGSTEVGGGEGGFYTQAEYQEVVAYAKDRFVTIIPEIDMPGHTNAALASYAQLNCDDVARELYTGTRVGFSSLCTQKEITYQFINDVIGELAALTPGPYIHVGGDESRATERTEYLGFIQRVQSIVSAHGKKMIGWDETGQAELQPGGLVQFWNNKDHVMEAVRKGQQVIMSPAKKTYLDMQYDSSTRLGLHWAGYIEVEDGYSWDPATYVEGLTDDNIVGVEAPLWTETIMSMDDIEFMIFPRLPGYAEIGWTPANLRLWDNYKERLAKHSLIWKAKGIDFHASIDIPWPK